MSSDKEILVDRTPPPDRKNSGELSAAQGIFRHNPNLPQTSPKVATAKADMDAFFAKIDKKLPSVASKVEAAQLFGRKPRVSKHTENAINSEVEKFDKRDEELKKALIEGRDFYAQHRPIQGSH
jgi:hypothetical protein